MKLSRLFTLFSLAAFLTAAVPHLNAAEVGQAYSGEQLVFTLPEDEKGSWDVLFRQSQPDYLIQAWEHVDGAQQSITVETKLQDPENPVSLSALSAAIFNPEEDVILKESENEMLFIKEAQDEEADLFVCAKLTVTPQASHALMYLAVLKVGSDHEKEKWISMIAQSAIRSAIR